ncbi:MAG: hypothetical protein HRT94_03685 [Alphaproteobacteria bacterium]|nr:hypothetical protein [Alphaproteobacteria bacterium]
MVRFVVILMGGTLCLCVPAHASEHPNTYDEVSSQENQRVIRKLRSKTRSILNRLSKTGGNKGEGALSEEEKAYNALVEQWMNESSDPFDIIFSLKRNGKQLDRALVGIQKGAEVYLPVLSLAARMELNADYDAVSGVVQGFAGHQDKTYAVDTKNNKYMVQGDVYDLPEGAVIVEDFGNGLQEVFVSQYILNKLWGFRLRFKQDDMALLIETPKLLPFEQRRQREQRQKDFVAGETAIEGDEPNYKFIPNDYKLIGKPAINVNTQVAWQDRTDNLAKIVNTHGVNDLLGASADYNVQLRHDTDDGFDIRNARLRLTRRMDAGHELPLGIRKVEAGDVSIRPPEWVERNVNGSGLTFSTKPFKKSQSFDAITVEGTGQPGWEVEVYNGNQLEDFGVIDQNGEYRFDDIQLSYGENKIRTVLYGPQGETQEIVENYNIANTLLASGETVIEGAVLEANQRLIELDDTIERDTDGYFHTAKIKRGLNEWLTPFVTSTSTNTEDGRKHYVSAGANFNALGGIGVVEAYKDLGGGSAIDTQYTKKFSGLRLNLRSALFNDFESEEVNFGTRAKTSEHELRAYTNVPVLGDKNLGLNLNATHSTYEDSTHATDVSFSQSIGLPYLKLSNRTNSDFWDEGHRSTTGRFSAYSRLSDYWSLRSILNYELYPDADLNTTRVEARYRDRDKFTSSFDVVHDLRNTNTFFGADASYDFGRFLGGIGINWDPGDCGDVTLRTSMSLGPFDKDGSYLLSSKDLTSRSALRSRIYHDKDMDGTFSEGDEPLSGASVKVNGLRRGEADEDGYIHVANAGARGLASVTLDEGSLTDGLLISEEEGYYTVLRPVTDPYIDMPVVTGGSLDGNAYFKKGDPAATLRLQLVDGDGDIHQETVTDFNGYYNFDFVKPGQYEVRIDPDQRIGMTPVTVAVSQDDPFVHGVDLQVRQSLAQKGGSLLSSIKNILSFVEKKNQPI